MDSPDQDAPPVAIPVDALSADALRGIIESFVLREGTDYGDHEVTLEAKVDAVRAQLTRGDVQILWDPNTESVQLVVAPRGAGRLR
jgi:uncharacterized protein YheU (UPF0270 family)